MLCTVIAIMCIYCSDTNISYFSAYSMYRMSDDTSVITECLEVLASAVKLV